MACKHKWETIGPADQPVGFHCSACDADWKVAVEPDHTVIFIGHEFYHQSGTFMGSHYEVRPDGYHRCATVFDQFLDEGHTVLVRPATEAERGYFALQLMAHKRNREQRARTEEIEEGRARRAAVAPCGDCARSYGPHYTGCRHPDVSTR